MLGASKDLTRRTFLEAGWISSLKQLKKSLKEMLIGRENLNNLLAKKLLKKYN